MAVFHRHAADGAAGQERCSSSSRPAGPAAAAGAGTRRRPAPQAPAPRPPGQADVTTPAEQKSREAALARPRRVPIETPADQGLDRPQGRAHRRHFARRSIARRSIPNSPAIVLLSPSGSPHPFYAEFGWVGAAGANVKAPGPDTDVAARGIGGARARTADHARLRQRRGAEVPPHHRGRRQVSVHPEDEVVNSGSRAGDALSLRADLAPRHAADARATTSCTKA